MSITDRPFAGSWKPNRTIVRVAPDAIVYVNGSREFSVCAACSQKIDLNKYITQVSADPSTDSIWGASISLSIPRHERVNLQHGGQSILQNGLEVVIYMRGFFPMKDFAGLGAEPADIPENFDPNGVAINPYYQVFRGVVVSTSPSFSGGFYTNTLSCQNLLHFWQYLHLATNGSVFGQRPSQSLVQPSLVGHKFTGANPYSIIYTLVKSGFGAAYGVDFTFSQSSNIRAIDDDSRKSLYKHAAEWWERRWTENSGKLRMYGIDGTVFNAFEQAYLGRWYDSRSDDGSSFYTTAKQVYASLRDENDYNLARGKELLIKARELAWDPLATSAAVYDVSGGKGTKFATEDVLRMQAFTLDLGKIGSINLFETEYMSKLQIAEAVKSITGYEFYQDVDGDLVFKPPMYNLDTRDDPVFVVKNRDLMDYSESESEPTATMVKGTGSHFANLTGHGIDGWMGVGAVYIDYRLVAQYGYREETFESNYMSSRQALFVSAMNRLDRANAEMKTATITIPLRPELRAGYPIYVEKHDAFYYIKSLSHSLTFGGQATTTITGIARRGKWLPPMEPGTVEGGLPSLSQVRLDSPGEFPPSPLYGFPQYLDPESGDSGPPKSIGFPNVVLALDPEKVNLSTIERGGASLTLETYIQMALGSGFLERGVEADTFILRSSNDGGEVISLTTLQEEWSSVSDALRRGEYTPEPDTVLGKILSNLARRGAVDVKNIKDLVNRLAVTTSLKSIFAPGTAISGKYRYYSCSHPEAEHQAPGNLLVDVEKGSIGTTDAGDFAEGFDGEVVGLTDVGEGKGVGLARIAPTRGIKVAALSAKQDGGRTYDSQVVRTADIRYVTFGPQVSRRQYQVSYIQSGQSDAWNFSLNPQETQGAMAVLLRTRAEADPSLSISERFGTEYSRLLAATDAFATSVGVAGEAPVLAARGAIASLGGALAKGGPLSASAADAPVSAASRKSDEAAVAAVARYLATALWGYVNAITTAGKKLLGADGDYRNLMKARSNFIRDYTDGAAVTPDTDPAKTFFFAEEYEETPVWTPIFPVSDAGGYEVYGSLPYGRGVNIEKYAALMQSKTIGDTDATAAEAASSSSTQVGTSGGSNASSMIAIEKFFAAYLLENDVGVIFGSTLLNDAEKRAILAAFNSTDVAQLSGAVEALRNQDTSQGAKIRNTPVTSYFRGMSTTGDAAARNLADLDVGSGWCSCQGTDPGLLVAALTEEWIDLYPDDPIGGFEQTTAYNQGTAWQQSRDALAGKNIARGSATEALEEAAAAFGNVVTDVFGRDS